ncbi:serine/threonine-protein kinase ULK2-like isoform X2 [Tachypleus tridentatus]
MKALKAKGIVHRDLKPQNILLCHDGRPNPPPSKIHLKIADFGFARFLHDGIMAATLCGSPMYMAPEVIMSLQYDAKADLWSIGTIIYQCLTGKAPFQAQSPQALKQFYEMKTTLSPKIPACTSPNLADLLLKLLKRNAKDRMEFSEFFRHVFLKPVNKPSSPVPVPSRRSLSSDVSSPISSPPCGSPISANLPPSPQGWWGEVSRDGPIPETGIQMAASTSLDKQSPGGRGRTSSSSTEEQDFVMVPADLADPSGNPHPSGSLKMHSVSPGSSPSRNQLPVTPSPRMSSNVTVDPHFGSARFHAPRVSGLGSPRPSYLPVSGSSAPTSSACVSRSCQRSEPIPVPSQKEAYEQIQKSLEEEPTGLVGVQRERTSSAARTSSSPYVPESSVFSSESTRPKKDSSNSQSSENWTVSTICSLSPPPIVQFTIGTPPGGGRRRTYSGGTPPSLSSRHISASLRQCFTSSPSLTLSTSPLRRSNVAMANLPTFATGNPLSPILGSPTKELSRTEEPHSELRNQKEYSKTKGMDLYRYSGSSTQRTPFSTRAVTLPEICSQKFWPGSGYGVPELMDHQKSSLNRSGSSSRLSERGFHRAISLPGTQYISHTPPETMMMPYGHPSHHCCLNEMMTPYGSPDRLRRNSTGCSKFYDSSFNTQPCFLYSNSPPHLEEPVMFIAPELPEETILEKEHNETLAKLNFVLALVECVLDLAKSKGSPLASLTDSFMNRESQLGQIPVVTEGWRRAEQLVLFTRALQLLSSSLQLSRQEVDAGRLSPSTSMRFVLQSLKERFHYCFNMCKSLNSPGTLHALGVDLSTYSITADQLIYNYAIEMCQSAALEELFGNPEECFRRYQTAQILFHSLAQQITNDEDKKLLNKYKEAVERRLYVLQSQGYVQAYDTTYC